MSGLALSGEAAPGVLQATQRKKEEKEDNNKNNIVVGLRKLLAFLFSFGVGEGACALSLWVVLHTANLTIPGAGDEPARGEVSRVPPCFARLKPAKGMFLMPKVWPWALI